MTLNDDLRKANECSDLILEAPSPVHGGSLRSRRLVGSFQPLLRALFESGSRSYRPPWRFDAVPPCSGIQEVQAPAGALASGCPFQTSACWLYGPGQVAYLLRALIKMMAPRGCDKFLSCRNTLCLLG